MITGQQPSNALSCRVCRAEQEAWLLGGQSARPYHAPVVGAASRLKAGALPRRGCCAVAAGVAGARSASLPAQGEDGRRGYMRSET